MKKTITAWPHWLDHILAKSPGNNEAQGESLPEHTWESLCRLYDLAQLRPWLPELCKFPKLWSVLFWALLFHDWGKVASGFQIMLRDGKRWPHRHEVLSLAFVSWIEQSISEQQAIAIMAAIVSHHRDASELVQLYPLGLSPEDDPCEELIKDVDEETIIGLYRWLYEVVPEWIQLLGFDKLGISKAELIEEKRAIDQIKQNGAKLIQKWLYRYQRLVRELQSNSDAEWILQGLFLRGSTMIADHIASAHAGPLPLLSYQHNEILNALGLSEEGLYEHQQQAASTTGSAVLISPTGSGKTEAALLWAINQRTKHKAWPRLFYVLPYQTSMNAMFDRLRLVFDGYVGLLHSRSLLVIYQRYIERDFRPDEAAQAARWAKSLARLHYYPVRVFSPYQMLKAGYQLKGYETMLTDFSGAAFIFDEVHAYEPERLAMILEFAKYLHNKFGAEFFIMSATLPSVIRYQIEEAIGKPAIIRASDDLYDAYARHEINLVDGDLLSEKGLAMIIGAFKNAQSVLVTCNTVTRAQEAYRILLENKISSESLILIHGRFNGRDRIEKEKDILKATGLKSADRRPIIVVATQVVEVSLNIDLDVLFTDPAPLEALIQRLGRVNRSRRKNAAICHVFSEPVSSQKIYMPALIEGSLGALKKYADGKIINERSVHIWLDEIYTGSILKDWEERYYKTSYEFSKAFLQSLRPFSCEDGLAQTFDQLFDGTEILPHCLESEYRMLLNERPIEASQLLVNISWRR
ncbi:MAG: CRISPR-associated helicase Cas3', partial [Actinomycetota bacterium]|nr:CRISPR-associated helicase Cas3' [Actinomycetota bacterium]